MPLRWTMLVVLFLVRLAMGYQFQVVASVSPHLVADLGLSYAQIGTLIGVFLLPGIVISIPSGTLTRIVADRNLLMVGAAMMIAGALTMAFADGVTGLYAGRLVTGIGGTIFNVILTKMVTDWFVHHEIVTALAVLLTAWPIGIALGLLTQGVIADAFGWPWAMHATGTLALIALVLTAGVYRDPPGQGRRSGGALVLGLPARQLVHTSIVGIAWTLYNASLIIFVSFVPDALMVTGYAPESARITASLATWAMLLSIPFGGRLLEVFGWITVWIVATLSAGTAAMVAVAQGVAPEVLSAVYGVMFGIPAGALMALTSQAITPDNRGPGLGIFFTWYYAGMTVAPAIAGWTRDVSGSPAAPVVFGATLLMGSVASVAVLRLLQATWPVVAKP